MGKGVKIVVAGVGGQGVVFLTNLIVEAAMQSNIPVATSEIHGLAQRGGSVTAGISLGENTSGFQEKAGVDILIGLEPLEAQRCVEYLHSNSLTVILDYKILPYSVNAGKVEYPDTDKFIDFLSKKTFKVIHIAGEIPGVKPILRNLYVLGRLSEENKFPIEVNYLESAIRKTARSGLEQLSLEAFRLGQELGKATLNYEESN
jgi:indolepyruvate ferredoxin oxidoreductase, beta subunit